MTPTAKEIKYDRQLRLWSANGQSALEASHLLLVNATATGTEILKNLVLPGIGAFTILDGKKVTGEDAGVNFFLEQGSIGSSRGEEAHKYISELNPDVSGHCITQDVKEVLSPEFFEKFSIVVATDLDETTALTLSKILWDLNIPLILVRSIGFIGSFRIIMPELTIVETHPEDVVDLRLDAPWPEIQKLASTLNLEEMDSFEHGHVPYILILLKLLEQWKETHGSLPTMKDRKALNELIQKEKRSYDEENFDEALAASFRACRKTEIPSEIQAILQDPKATNLTAHSSNFWILASCVREFVEDPNQGKGMLPLMGVVPDMKADSNRYILIQNCYRRKFKEDLQNVTERVQTTLSELGRDVNEISANEIESFVKLAGYLKVIRFRSLEEEYTSPKTKFIQNEFENTFPPTLIHYYFALRAYDKFITLYGRPPGQADHVAEEDGEKLIQLTNEVCGAVPSNPETVRNACLEIVRAGGGELHNIASLMGGLVAQEAIKLITRQYIPSDNTCVFDGITSSANVWSL